MKTRQTTLRDMAERLLEEGVVEAVLGYRRGTGGLREQPFVAHTPEDARQLVWTGFCTGNLSKMLLGRTGKTAIIAQGCVSRNIVGLIRERQIERENVYVLGVPCLGMLDRRKLQARAGSDRFEVFEEGTDVVVRVGTAEIQMPRAHALRDNCTTCLHRNPVIHDELAAQPVEDKGPGDIEMTSAPWEKLDPENKRKRFSEAYESCIRCYACRDVCPLCYCQVCFVDESTPQWCGKTQDDSDVQTFHLLRAFHCAGRCTDCGACESACPQGIKVRRLTSKLEKDVRELYGYEPWLNLEASPPLQVYDPEDPQESFM